MSPVARTTPCQPTANPPTSTNATLLAFIDLMQSRKSFASSVLSGQIQSLVRGVNDRWREISDAYSELYDGMKQRGFLGVSIREVTADAEDKAFLRRACKGLASAMQFEGGEQVHTLCGRNWVATSKILLSFYRRVTDLAEYYESGKVSMPLSS